MERCGDAPPAAGRGVVRSYDWQGRRFQWCVPEDSPGRWAIDVEAKDTPGTVWLSRRYGLSSEEFLPRWTATEVLAKLYDIPVLVWLGERGLASAPPPDEWTRMHEAWIRSIPHPTHWIAVGVLPAAEKTFSERGRL